MDLVQCDICGVVPEIRRSHSSRLIVHKCKDYSSGWHGHTEVVSDWNDSNSSKSKESTETGTQHTHEAILAAANEWATDNPNRFGINGFQAGVEWSQKQHHA